MIQHKTQKVFADKAYTSQEHDEYLASRKIENGILAKDYRNHTLTSGQE
jgi:IS5 family transposase